MRDLLTYLGVALILLLSAALAAPLAVDFDAWRLRIAQQLSSASGARVALNGPIALRLLPTPRLSAENFALSGPYGAARADHAFFELALPALIGGRLKFTAIRLDRADISIAADALGSLARLGGDAPAQIDRLALHDSRLTLTQPGAPALRLEQFDLVAQAPSLAGPFQGRGGFATARGRVGFSFASDVLAKGLLPVKASLTGPGAMGRADFEGKLRLAGAPMFEGEARAAGQAEAGPWQAQAALVARLDGAEAEKIELRLGEGPLADKVSGRAAYESARGKIALELDAPHLAEAWANGFAGPLLAASVAQKPLDLHFAVQALDWRGAAWSQARYDRRPGAPAQVEAEGPGGARVKISAEPKPFWRGRLVFEAADFPAFAAAVAEAAPFAGVKTRAVAVDGAFLLGPDAFVLTGANLRLDRARFVGDLRFTPQTAARRALLAARLTAPALELDATPDLAAPNLAAPLAGLDLDLSLEAQTVKLARHGESLADGGQIVLHVLREGATARLEKLELHHIGGADLSASGVWSGDWAGLTGEARLKAADVSVIAQVLARLAPNALTQALADRRKALSPADLTFRAQGANKDFELNGALGATKIAARFAPRADGKRAGAVELTAPEGGVLLGQLGAPVLLAQRLGPARVSVQAQPSGEGTFDLTAAGDVAGLHGAFRGVAREKDFDGDLSLAGDAGKVWQSFGAAQASLPIRAAAHLVGGAGRVEAQNLSGTWDGVGFAGALAFGAEGMGGALTCDRLSAPALVALVLGPPAPAKAGAIWSSLSFAPVILDPPRAKIGVTTANLEPFGGKARFDLALGPGLLGVSGATVDLAGGILRGGFDLRREGGQVTLAGDVEGETLSLGNPAFSAKIDGKAHFAGNGASAAALVGSLAGSGTARARDFSVAAASPAGLDAALAASAADEAPFDAARVARSLDEAFARDPWRAAQTEFTVSLASGRLTLFDKSEAVEASYDWRDAAFSLSVSLAAQTAPPGGTATPRGKVVWAGPWASPARRVDATSFVNAVATRELEREQARIERLKTQDRERLRALQTP
jgi:hypothetical protein